jgi:hypothetical protein
MTKPVRLLPNVMSCVLVALLSACGGGGTPSPGGSGSITSYQVSATAGAGGTISPSSATVNAGGTTTFTVTPKTGYFVSGFTECGADGSLVGTTFTTGTINAACTVTASFAAAFTWFGGSNAPARSNEISWTDANGNLWLFAGYQYDDSTNTRFEMNDLWMYPASQ